MRIASNWLLTVSLASAATVLVYVNTVSAQSQSAGTITWSSKLHLKRIDEIPDRLRAPLLEESERLRLTSGSASREVANCDEYLNAVSAGFHPANNYENKMSASFIYECFVLRDLQHARPATSRHSYHWAVDSLTQLPPVLVPGSREVTDAAAKAEKRGESWKQLNPALKLKKIEGDLLLAQDADYAYSLQILARADFNGDGVEDLAVYGAAQGKHSTWLHAEYFILSPTGNGKLVPLPNRPL